MSEFKTFVKLDDVETQVHPWGKLQWMSEPRVTGSKNMTTGYIDIDPGKGHGWHNHEGCEEILYVLEGKVLQTVEAPDGKVEKEMGAGELVFIPAGAFHSSTNIGEGKLVFLAVYQFAGPEAALRADPECSVLPPKNG